MYKNQSGKLMRRIAVCSDTVALFMGVASGVAFAGPPYSVDDPGTAEAGRTNITVLFNSSQVRGSEAQQLPNITFGYGFSDRLELDWTSSLNSTRFSGSGRTMGFGDIILGAKWRFRDESKHAPQWAVAYGLKIPTADPNRGLGSGATDHGLTLSMAKSFGRAQLFSNVGYNLLAGNSGTSNFFYGTGLSYQATEQLNVGVQLCGNTPNAPGNRSEFAYGLGAVYNFAPDRSFLFSIGKSAQGFSDLNISAGIQFTVGHKAKQDSK